MDGPGELAVAARLAGAAPLRGDPDAGLREVYLHVTHRCARACRHCYDRGAASGPELTTAAWSDVIDQCAALGARSFVVIGGDPLLRPDLATLIDHACGVHGGSVRFFFNSLIDAGQAAALAQAGHGRLTPLASVDGPRRINDELRGSGSYDDVMASIANLLAAGLEPVANTVLVQPALAGSAARTRAAPSRRPPPPPHPAAPAGPPRRRHASFRRRPAGGGARAPNGGR